VFFGYGMRYSKVSILGLALSFLLPFILYRYGNALRISGVFWVIGVILIIFIDILGIYLCKKNGLKGIEFSIFGLIIILAFVAFFIFIFLTMPPF